ncbi:MAG TPA: hypothetical protein VJK66_06105 [Gaiellaceae bacterium]|nr:hypothetical protein [Gaiellaceae bacterium]
MPMTRDALIAALASGSAKHWIWLVEIFHLAIPDPPYAGHILRLCSNTEPVVHGGETFNPALVRPQLVERAPDQPARATLVIHWADPLITELRNLQGQAFPTVTLKIVLSDTPSTIQKTDKNLQARVIHYDLGTIEAELGVPARRSAAVPRLIYTPLTAPALF